MNHDLIGGYSGNVGNILLEELNKAGGKHQNKKLHRFGTDWGRDQEI